MRYGTFKALTGLKTLFSNFPFTKIPESLKLIVSRLPGDLYFELYLMGQRAAGPLRVFLKKVFTLSSFTRGKLLAIRFDRVSGSIKTGLFTAASFTVAFSCFLFILASYWVRAALALLAFVLKKALLAPMRLAVELPGSLRKLLERLRPELEPFPMARAKRASFYALSVTSLAFVHLYVTAGVLEPGVFEGPSFTGKQGTLVLETEVKKLNKVKTTVLHAAPVAKEILNEEKRPEYKVPGPETRILDGVIESGPGPTIGAPLINITRGGRERMDIALTFDGGSEATEAREILDELRAHSIKTTIFLTGTFIKDYPGLVRQMITDGHEIGNHTMTHPHLTEFARTFNHTTLAGISKEFLAEELRTTAEAFIEVTGLRISPLWRAPYGEINSEIIEWALDEGYIHVGWTMDYKKGESLDTLDWVHDRSSRFYRTSSEIKANVLGFGKGSKGLRGGIILMHLGTERTDDRASVVLGEIIDGLTDMGYRFVKVSSLIGTSMVYKNLSTGKEKLAMTMP
jgi:peptidoglycan/xylan/chitin deacetylase (PgdA/CDA1 family)